MKYDYLVSGVWKNLDTVTAMLVHKSSTYGFDMGTKMSLHHVTKLIKSGCTFAMMKWDYTRQNWFIIDEIEVKTLDGNELLQPKRLTEGLSFQMLINVNKMVPDLNEGPPLINTRPKKAVGN